MKRVVDHDYCTTFLKARGFLYAQLRVLECRRRGFTFSLVFVWEGEDYGLSEGRLVMPTPSCHLLDFMNASIGVHLKTANKANNNHTKIGHC